MKYFSYEELTKSITAKNKGIDNTPSIEIKKNLKALVDNILDPLREAYGKPITVTSGYRCPKLNTAVKGAKNSQHIKGQAADINGVKDLRDENKKLFDLVLKLKLPFDQLIDEYDYIYDLREIQKEKECSQDGLRNHIRACRGY